MVGGARGSDGSGSQGSAPHADRQAGSDWNFYREGGLLWHAWGNEDPNSLVQGTTDAVVSVAGIQDQLRAQPNIFSRAGTLTDILIPMGVAGVADQRVNFAIYKCNPDSLYPTDRIWDSGSILVNTVATGGVGTTGYLIRPNLQIDPGVHFLAWTCNALFGVIPSVSFMYMSPPIGNTVIPWLGVPDRGWTAGFNNPGAPTISQFTRAGCQWAVQSFPYATPPAVFPGTNLTTPIADGSTAGLSYAGAQQLKGGGPPIKVMFRFNPA